MKDCGSGVTTRQLWGQTAEDRVKYKRGIQAKYLKTLLPFPWECTFVSQLTAKKFTETFYMKIELLGNKIKKTGCTKKLISPSILPWNISVLTCCEQKHMFVNQIQMFNELLHEGS